VVQAMLEGWARQQRVRFLKGDTIRRRPRVVERLVEISGLSPWQWPAADVEAFLDSMRGAPAADHDRRRRRCRRLRR
jgi:hypothetical protein